MTLRDRLPDITAAVWLLVLVVGVVTSTLLLLYRVRITGSVPAAVVVRSVVRPLVYVVGAILLVITYVASIELFGKTETNGAITRLVRLIQDAGAARELRRRDEQAQGGDSENE